MKPLTSAQIERIAARYGSIDGLAEELGRKLSQRAPAPDTHARFLVAARAIVKVCLPGRR